MQLLQPLAVQHVGLAAGHVLDAPGVHQLTWKPRSSSTPNRGAAHFLRETVGLRVRRAGASGQLTMRADSGFYTHAVVAVCRKMNVRFSITVRQHAPLRCGPNLIEAIPEADWTPVPYWMDGAADVAETSYRACLRSQSSQR